MAASKFFALTALAATLLLAAPLAFGQVTYSWENDTGVDIYGQAPPNDRPYKIHHPDGREEMVYPQSHDEPDDPSELVPIYSEEQQKQMSDRLLLLKYENEEQITEQMNVELNHLGYDKRLLDQSNESLWNSFYELVRSAADRQRAGLEVEPEQREQIESVRKRLEENRLGLQDILDRQDGIRQEFQAELERYRYLKGTENAGGPGQRTSN